MERVEAIDAGQMTIWLSRFAWRNCWRGCARSSAAPAGKQRRLWRLTISAQHAKHTGQGRRRSSSPDAAQVPADQLSLSPSGRVVPPSELRENLYDHDNDHDPNAIGALIGGLRRKLKVNVIETHRGFGYFVAGSAA
jgi:two-component system, OmpR family, response regulator